MSDDLVAKLYGWKPPLLDEPTFKEITALNDWGKPDNQSDISEVAGLCCNMVYRRKLEGVL